MSTIAQSIEQMSINTIRTLAMDAVQAANSGHPGTPNGARSRGIPIVDEVLALRSGRSALAEPRSVRPLLRSRFDAALRADSPGRHWRRHDGGQRAPMNLLRRREQPVVTAPVNKSSHEAGSGTLACKLNVNM